LTYEESKKKKRLDVSTWIEQLPITHEIPIQEHNHKIKNKINIHEQTCKITMKESRTKSTSVNIDRFIQRGDHRRCRYHRRICLREKPPPPMDPPASAGVGKGASSIHFHPA
jgi:hypothetical protein